jgi:hypothetical protein
MKALAVKSNTLSTPPAGGAPVLCIQTLFVILNEVKNPSGVK